MGGVNCCVVRKRKPYLSFPYGYFEGVTVISLDKFTKNGVEESCKLSAREKDRGEMRTSRKNEQQSR